MLLRYLWVVFVLEFGLVWSYTYELASSDEFYSSLRKAQERFSLLYVYKPGCRYCSEVGPKLDYVMEQFQDAQVDLLKADGVKLNDLVVNLRVTHFPQLFLFGPGYTNSQNFSDSGENSHGVKRNSLFREDRTVANLASWIADCIGELPKWSESRVIDHIESMEQFNSTFPAEGVALLFGESHQPMSTAMCLAFANSWMEAGYAELFFSDIDSSVLNKLSNEWPDIDFYLFDSSLASLAQLTNRMQVAFGLPSVYFLYQDKIITVGFWPYDFNSKNKEKEYINRILASCIQAPQNEQECEELVALLPHVSIQRVQDWNVSDMQLKESEELDDIESGQALESSMHVLYDF